MSILSFCNLLYHVVPSVPDQLERLTSQDKVLKQAYVGSKFTLVSLLLRKVYKD